ncbi:MAG: cytochrome c [Vicinamibacterales bacterium]
MPRLPRRALPVAVFLVGALAGFTWSHAAAAPAAVFTAAQAEQGRTVYRASCAGCHAGDLGGRDDAPALAGPDFLKTWGPRTTEQLYDFIRTTMPPDGATLPGDDYLALVAHLLERNGAVAGDTVLDAATAVGISAVAPGRP